MTVAPLGERYLGRLRHDGFVSGDIPPFSSAVMDVADFGPTAPTRVRPGSCSSRTRADPAGSVVARRRSARHCSSASRTEAVGARRVPTHPPTENGQRAGAGAPARCRHAAEPARCRRGRRPVVRCRSARRLRMVGSCRSSRRCGSRTHGRQGPGRRGNRERSPACTTGRAPGSRGNRPATPPLRRP